MNIYTYIYIYIYIYSITTAAPGEALSLRRCGKRLLDDANDDNDDDNDNSNSKNCNHNSDMVHNYK